jgi:sugar/nucleoside kinase (ribokinase family)
MKQSARIQICESTSRKLAAAAPTMGQLRALVGLDGFVDEIIAVVNKRQDFDHYEPIRTIESLGEKILRASGQSSNYELVVRQIKLGGNGPIMANALGAAGATVTYVGALGYPTVHAVFKELDERATVYSFCDPGHTDALEFEDGKLMLGKHTPFRECNWDVLMQRVGRDKMISLVGQSQLVAMVNWTMLPFLSQIWQHIVDEILPAVPSGRRYTFFDLCDPEKRTQDDLRHALGIISAFQGSTDAILGLNLKEAGQVAAALGVDVGPEPEMAIEATAVAIRERMNISCVVVHPRRGAAAATASESSVFHGPFVTQPKISTGAGDHFNAGFCLGRMLGFTLTESLCTGVATSGYYVRTGVSPEARELARFIADLPHPQAD